MSSYSKDLKITLGGETFANPLFMASGTFGYGEDLTDIVDYSRIGGIFTKGISVKPMEGNPPPRIIETASGMLNSIGLQNIGLQAFLKNLVPGQNKLKTKIITNIFGVSIDEFVELAEAINDVKTVSGVEMNISCPNVKKGGIEFGIDPKSTSEVVAAVRKHYKKLLVVKLTPNVTDPTLLAKAAVDAGADALTVSNTFLGMRIDIRKKSPSLSTKFGGLSGPAILPINLRIVWRVSSAVKVPILASGGVISASDAIEYILAGATGIQVGTATYINPRAVHDILDGVIKYLKEQNITLDNLIGLAKKGTN